jgi:MFS family permease
MDLKTERRNKRFVLIDAIGVGIGTSSGQYLPVFLTRMGATNTQVGLLTSMPGVTGLLLALLVGRFLQTRRNIVPWFSLSRLLVISAYALTGVVPFIVPRPYVVPAVLGIWAIATLPQITVAVCFSVVMNAVAGPEGRYELMSRRWSILGISTALAVAIAGQVLERIDLPLNYQLVFFGLSLGGLISYYFSSRIKLPDAEPVSSTAGQPLRQRLRHYIELVRHEPAFISFAAKRFVYSSALTLAAPLFPLYYVRELHASDAWVSYIVTAQTFVLMVGYIFWARQSRKRGSRLVLLASTLAMALYPALMALTHNLPLVVFYSGLFAIFQAGLDLVFFDELMRTVPPQYAPTFVSLAQSIQYLSAILAPLAGTFLADHIGLDGGLLVSAGLRLIGFLLFTRKGPRLATIAEG